MSVEKISKDQEGTSATLVQLEKVCDLAYLHRMSSGNTSFVKEIIKLYVQQVPLELNKLQEAIAAGTTTDIKGIAHKLKSSASMIGAESIVSRLKSIETLAVSETATTQLFEQLCSEVLQLNTKALEEELLPHLNA